MTDPSAREIPLPPLALGASIAALGVAALALGAPRVLAALPRSEGTSRRVTIGACRRRWR